MPRPRFELSISGIKSEALINIKMGPKEIAWEGVEWTHMAQNRDQW
jgi:hypothetical protein